MILMYHRVLLLLIHKLIWLKNSMKCILFSQLIKIRNASINNFHWISLKLIKKLVSCTNGVFFYAITHLIIIKHLHPHGLPQPQSLKGWIGQVCLVPSKPSIGGSHALSFNTVIESSSKHLIVVNNSLLWNCKATAKTS